MEPVIATQADFQKYNFFRVPEWRWERVVLLTSPREGGAPGRCNRRDDEYVRAGRNFQLRWSNGDHIARERLKWENPGLFYAYDFYQRCQDDPDSALYLEARILAGMTPQQIFETMGILPSAVEWYGRLFFDVAPYLKQRDWITKQVLVPAMKRSLLPPPTPEGQRAKDAEIARPYLDGTLKLFSYFGGPNAADLMIAGMQMGKPLVSADDSHNWLDGVWSTSVRRRSVQAAQTFNITKYNVIELFNVHGKIIELDRAEDSTEKSRSTMEKQIKALMDEIPWTVGDDGARLYDGTMVGRFDNNAAELRDDEILRLASGETASTLQDTYPDELPPPRRARAAKVMETVELQ